ncbi:hypothetical protein [Paenibacillus elgii]|uniref:hypothetical protein n=1 Tax=Paenibacillus elgii TaxID=189691 RepID=UPI000A4CCD3A|nr:hypothetical protein [Paenibacillus elgii]
MSRFTVANDELSVFGFQEWIVALKQKHGLTYFVSIWTATGPFGKNKSATSFTGLE